MSVKSKENCVFFWLNWKLINCNNRMWIYFTIFLGFCYFFGSCDFHPVGWAFTLSFHLVGCSKTGIGKCYPPSAGKSWGDKSWVMQKLFRIYSWTRAGGRYVQRFDREDRRGKGKDLFFQNFHPEFFCKLNFLNTSFEKWPWLLEGTVWVRFMPKVEMPKAHHALLCLFLPLVFN